MKLAITIYVLSLSVCGGPIRPTYEATAEACVNGSLQTFQCDPCYLLAAGTFRVLQNGATDAECDAFLAGK